MDGYSPETIVAECFPALSLEQVYGAITYCLSDRRKMDAHLRQADDYGEPNPDDFFDVEDEAKVILEQTGLTQNL